MRITTRSTLFFVVFIQSLTSCVRQSSDPKEFKPTAGAYSIDELTVVLDVRGRPDDFNLSINSSGDAHLASHYRDPPELKFEIDSGELNKIREMVRSREFFSLPQTIGHPTLDARQVTIVVVLGDLSHSVTIYQFGDNNSRLDAESVYNELYKIVHDATHPAKAQRSDHQDDQPADEAG